MGKNLEGSGLAKSIYCTILSFVLEGLRKTTKNTGQDSRGHGQDLNWASPEYKSRRYRKANLSDDV